MSKAISLEDMMRIGDKMNTWMSDWDLGPRFYASEPVEDPVLETDPVNHGMVDVAVGRFGILYYMTVRDKVTKNSYGWKFGLVGLSKGIGEYYQHIKKNRKIFQSNFSEKVRTDYIPESPNYINVEHENMSKVRDHHQ